MGAGNALRSLTAHQQRQDNIRRAGGNYGTRHDLGGAGKTPTALTRRL
jgi:hypothetical protein